MIKLIHDNFLKPNQKSARLLKAIRGKVDLILTDPPFNIADKGKVTLSHGKLWSTAEAWGDHFQDTFTEAEYDEFIEQFLRKSFVLLKPGGALISFIDDKYAGVLIRIAESINKGKEGQPTGFAHKKNIHFVKVNCVPKLRAWNYASACEIAVWMIKPRLKGSSKAKPEIFNYQKPQKGLRHPDGALNIREYHNTYSSNVFFYNIGKKLTNHPCEKYQDTLTPLITTHSNEDSLVLDPFFGGGSCALACKRLNRKFIGFDISKEWYDKAEGLLKDN